LERLRKYFRANPGALFIIAFQILLLSAALLFVEGDSRQASGLSVYAFYALVIGVGVQAWVAIREERNRAPTGSDDPSPASKTGT
jgi:hypothetical protein